MRSRQPVPVIGEAVQHDDQGAVLLAESGVVQLDAVIDRVVVADAPLERTADATDGRKAHGGEQHP
jgi:hypothetical protein